MSKKKIETKLKELEEEYLDIYMGQVEFKKGYRDYDAYKCELIDFIDRLNEEGER